MRILIGIVAIVVLSLGVDVIPVKADAWWGEGYRDPDWVLRHGGTIIDYKISGARKDRERYKAVMFQGGDYVEAEFGTRGVFDDAKNGTYQISVFLCDDDCSQDKKYKKHKGDKVLLSTTIFARPGKRIMLALDIDAKRVGQSVSYRYFSPPSPTKVYGLSRKDVVPLSQSKIEEIHASRIDGRFACTQQSTLYQLPILDQYISSRYVQCQHLTGIHLLPGDLLCFDDASLDRTLLGTREAV